MLNRIKWNQVFEDYKSQNVQPDEFMQALMQNRCLLVWEAALKDYKFKKWGQYDIHSEMEAKKCLAEKGIEYYYDMALNYNPD